MMGHCNKCHGRGIVKFSSSSIRKGFKSLEHNYCSCKAGKYLKEKHDEPLKGKYFKGSAEELSHVKVDGLDLNKGGSDG